MTFSHGVINDYISRMNSDFVSLLYSKSISLILASMYLLSFFYNVYFCQSNLLCQFSCVLFQKAAQLLLLSLTESCSQTGHVVHGLWCTYNELLNASF